jgi:hypothetical protein
VIRRVTAVRVAWSMAVGMRSMMAGAVVRALWVGWLMSASAWLSGSVLSGSVWSLGDLA